MANGSLNGREDLPARQLHDLYDREELRSRYYGLLQELRVLLPGAQIIVAFFLTVPFAPRFANLDELGRLMYGAALATGTIAIASFAAPIAIHRVGRRQARSSRLIWSIACMRVGMVVLACSLTIAVTMINRFVFNNALAVVAAVSMMVLLGTAWVLLPLHVARQPMADHPHDDIDD